MELQECSGELGPKNVFIHLLNVKCASELKPTQSFQIFFQLSSHHVVFGL